MSQTSISTKHTTTVVATGTAGVTFNPAGRDDKDILIWRGVTDAGVPLSDSILSSIGKKTSSGWNASLKLVTPLMETLAAGDSFGYVAGPKQAGQMTVSLQISRPDRMSTANALIALEQLAYALLENTALQGELIGYARADA